jgi:putative ABC transport system permease protein
METLLQDVRYGARMLLKHRSTTAIAVVTLALAIGVNTVIFSFVDFFALRPLPVRDIGRLVYVFGTHPERGGDRIPVSYAEFVDWRRQATRFESLAAFTTRTFNLTGKGEPLRVKGRPVSAAFFEQWGVPAFRGRTIRPDEDRPGGERVAVLAHGFWERQFGSDPAVLDHSIRLDGRTYTVVGILDPKIEIGSLSEIDVWTPIALSSDPEDWQARDVIVTGRLAPGATLDEAAAELKAIAAREQREHPATQAGWSVRLSPFRDAMTSADTWVILAMLSLCVAFVLAIACANVANLMLVRSTVRERETAVRLALGASRRRLVRQLVTEGALLALLGGAVGVLLASWGLQLIRSVTYEPFFDLVRIDRRVLSFSAAISLLTPLIFALVPALRSTRGDVVGALKEGTGRSATGSGGGRGRSALVVLQLALALSLLIVAGLSVRSALAVQRLRLGFDTKELVTLRIDLPAAKYGDGARIRAFFDELLGEIARLPQSRGAAAASALPVLQDPPTAALTVDGDAPVNPEVGRFAARVAVTPGYFRALGLPLLQGRSFTQRDVADSEPVAVVSTSLVSRYLAGGDPIGRRIRLGPPESQAPWLTVVGVAGDVQSAHLGDPPTPHVYVPFGQQPERAMVVLVRSSDTAAVVGAARSALARLDPDQPLYDARTMREALHIELASMRLITGLFFTFAAVALGLAAVGLYGVVSYAVSQRTREIGVRMALGAQTADVIRMVLGQSLVLIGIGLAVGLAAGLGLARAMASALFGVRATDPLTFVAVAATLGSVALVAALVPARRATKVDPIQALRWE